MFKALLLSLLLMVLAFTSSCKRAETPEHGAQTPAQEKAEKNIQIVHVEKYVERGYQYRFRTPLLVLSIKNNSDTPIHANEFRCSVCFRDVDNKRTIHAYGKDFLNDFSVIKPNYTSPQLRFGLKDSNKLLPLIGQVPIDFRIKVKVAIWLKDYKEDVQLSEVIFDPKEYNLLPLWD
jgi:hypothetical protein